MNQPFRQSDFGPVWNLRWAPAATKALEKREVSTLLHACHICAGTGADHEGAPKGGRPLAAQEYEGHEDELHASLRKIYGVDASQGREKAAPAEVSTYSSYPSAGTQVWLRQRWLRISAAVMRIR